MSAQLHEPWIEVETLPGMGYELAEVMERHGWPVRNIEAASFAVAIPKVKLRHWTTRSRWAGMFAASHHAKLGSNPSGREPKAPASPLAVSVPEAVSPHEPPSCPELPYPQSPLASRRA